MLPDNRILRRTFQDDDHLKDNERSNALRARPQIPAASFPDWHSDAPLRDALSSPRRLSHLPSISINHRKQDDRQILFELLFLGNFVSRCIEF